MPGRPIVATHAEIERRKQRWCALYDPSSDVKHLYVVHLDAELPVRPWPRQDNTAARIEWAWEKYERQIDRLAWLDDDSVPFLDLFTGTDIFAAAFGCPVHYPEADMPFALPAIRSTDEVRGLPQPTLDAAPIRQLFEIGHALRARAGDRALLRIPDIQSPMDIAALIWEKEDFFRALKQAPDAVEALAAKVRAFLLGFLDEWFRTFGPEFIAHYPDYYMPRGLSVSEDEVGSVSNRMFERLFLPELVGLSLRYGGLGMHCCANARHQWASFRKIPGLKLLNFVQPAEVTEDAIAYFAGHAAQMHRIMGEGPAWTWAAQHSHDARLVFDVEAQSREEALEVMSRVRERA
jgi:hypothetical protein